MEEKAMSRASYHRDDSPLRGVYRDRENGWIFGVCAGLAEFANFRTGTVRIIALISLVLFFWSTILIYIGSTLLFRVKPLTYAGTCREYEFWRRHSSHDRWSHS
jgi:phage shock protein PspC (stress-responsive transcriptional regulator)